VDGDHVKLQDAGSIIIKILVQVELIRGEIIAHGVRREISVRKITVGIPSYMQMQLHVMPQQESVVNGNGVLVRKKTVILLILQMRRRVLITLRA